MPTGGFGTDFEAVRLVLGSMPDIALLVARNGEILYANREAPDGQTVGSTLFDHNLSSEAHDRIRQALATVFEEGEAVSYEVESRDVAGESSAWYLSRWSPVERDGAVVAALVVASDITHRVRLARDLERLSHVGTWEWDPQTGEVTWSRELYEIYRADPETFRPSFETFLELVHPDDREFIATLTQRAIETGEPFSVDERIVRLDGEERVLLSSGRVESDAHGRPRLVGVCVDITDRKRAEDELERVSRQREAILTSAAEGVLGIDRDGAITFANPAAAGLLGCAPEDLHGRNVHDALHSPADGDAAHVAADCPIVLALPAALVEHVEEDVFWRPDGKGLPVRYTSSPITEHGEVAGAVLTFNDVTERKRFESQLRYLADHDPVTGLFNRRRFEQELSRHLAYSARYGTGGAVLALDIDNFKYVNDTLGHKAGDEVIGRVARNVRDRMRETDTLARLGGDEFVVLLPEAGIEEAQKVAQVILDAVRRQAVVVAGQQIRITASVGVTTFGGRADVRGDELLVEADLAMYDAKAAGRDRFALYTPMTVRQAQIESRIAWVERIRSALDEDRFVLHAQPIVPVAGGDPVQHELLLRMVGEDGETILPTAFLPSAERFGLMPAIDRWVVARAARLLAELDPRIQLEVNISGDSMADRELPRMIQAELADAGVDPRRLIVEITETAAIANLDDARSFAQHLTGIGCSFALDDFGAGFGSFYYLKYLPFDFLKIDGDFIHSLPASRTDQLIVKALVDIAGGLGKQTIAEWVGDDDTLALLREYGVDLAQGYHLGRPAPADRLVSCA